MPEPLSITERLAAERVMLNGNDWAMPVALGLAPTIAICGLLQLAMRHPGTKGSPTAQIAREFINGVVTSLEESGFKEHAQLVRLGGDPAHDRPI